MFIPLTLAIFRPKALRFKVGNGFHDTIYRLCCDGWSDPYGHVARICGLGGQPGSCLARDCVEADEEKICCATIPRMTWLVIVLAKKHSYLGTSGIMQWRMIARG